MLRERTCTISYSGQKDKMQELCCATIATKNLASIVFRLPHTYLNESGGDPFDLRGHTLCRREERMSKAAPIRRVLMGEKSVSAVLENGSAKIKNGTATFRFGTDTHSNHGRDQSQWRGCPHSVVCLMEGRQDAERKCVKMPSGSASRCRTIVD